MYSIVILFGFGFPDLFELIKEGGMVWWKVMFLIFMFLALTVSVLLNLFWMYLIVEQLKRIITRLSHGELAADIS